MILLFSAVAILGGWLFYFGSFEFVSVKARLAVSRQKRQQGIVGYWIYLIEILADRIEPYLNISEQRKRKYQYLLQLKKSTTAALTPSAYISYKLARSTLVAGIGILLTIRNPILFFIMLGYAIFLYWYEDNKLKQQYIQRRQEIESDLPKLCSVIHSRLRGTANVALILESFLPIASPAMKHELMLTVSDMHTGSGIGALLRLEQRITSPMVSDVVRGLISVLNGDDQSVYFQTKQFQFNNDYQTQKQKDIRARPSKLIGPGVLTFGFFLALVAYPLMVIMKDLLSAIF